MIAGVPLVASRPSLVARVLERVRAWSDAVRRAIVIALLAVVYAIVLPAFAVYVRVLRAEPRGWQRRADADVAAIGRLRRPF